MNGRPSQKSQASRKGKRAWRKNIDLDDVEQGLETQREQEVVLGPGPLFEIDTKGDEATAQRMAKKYKSLKSQEILKNKSSVPALVSSHRKSEKPKRKAGEAKVYTLQRASGRTGEDTKAIEVEREGINRSSGYIDLWGADTQVCLPTVKHEVLAPEPLVPGAQAVEIPHGGRSYNPTLEDWRALVNEEHAKLEIIERQRLKYEAQKAEVEAEMRAEAERAELRGLDDESSSEEDEDSAEVGEVRLSVNQPVQVKKKTAQQRRRASRARQREINQQRHKLLRRRLHDLHEQARVARAATKKAEEGLNAAGINAADSQAQVKPVRVARKHSRHPMLEPPLAIKLSHELEGSLRRLKPEGNLAKERLSSFQARGIIEARVKVHHKRPKTKTTEKWSYKNFDEARRKTT